MGIFRKKITERRFKSTFRCYLVFVVIKKVLLIVDLVIRHKIYNLVKNDTIEYFSIKGTDNQDIVEYNGNLVFQQSDLRWN